MRVIARFTVNKLNRILDERKIIERSKKGRLHDAGNELLFAADELEKHGFAQEAAIIGYLARNPSADIFCDEYTRGAMKAAVRIITDELDKGSGTEEKQTASL